MGLFSNLAAAQNFFIQSTQPNFPIKGALWVDSGKTPRPTMQIFDGTSFNDEVEPGSIIPWGGAVASIPTGWFLCNDQAISRTDFANLFDVIGTRFGTGDGSTTFNVPDLRGKFPRGAGNAADPGSTGGESTHTLTEAELATHDHAVTDPGHTHNIAVTFGDVASGAIHASDGGASNITTASVTTGLTVDDAGSGTAHENKPEFQEFLWIIKT